MPRDLGAPDELTPDGLRIVADVAARLPMPQLAQGLRDAADCWDEQIAELEAEVERLRKVADFRDAEALKAVNDQEDVEKERDLYRDLLVQAREEHDYDYERDPWAGEADECPCQWCDDVRAVLERPLEGEGRS